MADNYREPIDGKDVQAPLVNQAEKEILELEQQLASKKALLQEKEKPLEQVLAKEQASIVVQDSASVSLPSAAQPVIVAPLQAAQALSGQEKGQQIKALVDLAFQKGVNYAADVARNLESPYLMDEFHDTLIDQLHKELVEKGKLEEM